MVLLFHTLLFFEDVVVIYYNNHTKLINLSLKVIIQRKNREIETAKFTLNNVN